MMLLDLKNLIYHHFFFVEGNGLILKILASSTLGLDLKFSAFFPTELIFFKFTPNVFFKPFMKNLSKLEKETSLIISDLN